VSSVIEIHGFFSIRCEMHVEAVKRRANIRDTAEIEYSLRKVWHGFLTSRVGSKGSENIRVAPVFHFCAAPTVTAGLIGFEFDIR
jgi:hypothetical protein